MHPHYRPTKYHSVDDVPDELVKRHSKRDPNNMIYQTQRWVDFKKKQILFSQQDGVPIYLRTPRGRFTYYFLWAGVTFGFFYNIYLFRKFTNK